MFHSASLQFVAEIPFQLALVKLPILNNQPSPMEIPVTDKLKKALNVIGPPVHSIETTSNMRFLKVCYTDSSFVMIDRTVMQPE